MNVKFNYYYRDGANYKFYNSLVYKNENDISISLIEDCIIKGLIDREYFVPKKWNIPLVNIFTYDAEIDHDLYTYDGVENTDEKITQEMDIKNVLESILKISK